MLYALLWNLLLTAALALVLATVCRLPWMSRRPALVHWLWLLLLLKLVTPPLVPVPLLPALDSTLPATVTTAPPITPTPLEPRITHAPPAPATPPYTELPLAEPSPAPVADIPVSASNNEPALNEGPQFSDRLFNAAAAFSYNGGILGLSLIGTCAILIVYVLRAVRFDRWLKRAGVGNAALTESCDRVAARMGIRTELQCSVIDTRTTPLLWGWRRPIVAVPQRLIEELRPEQLRTILAHEIAHLIRRDHWANVFVCVVKALMWWNPVVWWADRELRVAQEMCCDAIAIERCNANRSSYAATLLKTLDFIQPPVASSRLALGIGSRGTILRRFEMIGERGLAYRMSRWAILGLLVLAAALVCMPVRGQHEKAAADTAGSTAKSRQDEQKKNRPHGNCSISGKVVCAETGEPLKDAKVYLFYLGTHASIYVDVAGDGTFTVDDIPPGPHTLRSLEKPGYQAAVYNPEGKSGSLLQFSLKPGEHRSGVVLKAKPAYRISGKIRDAKGGIPKNPEWLVVSAILKKEDRYVSARSSSINHEDGSYLIDGLDGQPVYVMVTDRGAEKEGDNRPPVFYPGTFSRSKAKQVVFDEDRSAEGIDIKLRTKGGATLEGKIVNEAGDPVPETLVLVHRRDMFGDILTTYTDERGTYQVRGLGEGQFLVHVDAAHRGYVRLRTPFDINDAKEKMTRDFTLTKGVLISGKFIDQDGNDWQIGRSYGYASVLENRTGGRIFSRGGLFNKYQPKNFREHYGCSFGTGEGRYGRQEMIFPTENTFAIHGMMPGHTQLGFLPTKEDQSVLDMRYRDRNILVSGLDTAPGEKIENVVIVIGKRKPGKAPETASNVLTLKDGETGRMKVGHNATPVAELAITPQFVDERTKFVLEALDAKGRPIDGTRVTTHAAPDKRGFGINLGRPFHVDDKDILAVISLTPSRRSDSFVDVQTKFSIMPMPKPAKTRVRPRMPGKYGEQRANMHEIARLIGEHKRRTGRYPENLKELNQDLPTDVYSPKGESYHYVAQHSRFILSGCGKDGVHGNDDDDVLVSMRDRTASGHRASIFPLEPVEVALAQKEECHGERPHGDCALGGRVVSAATGLPLSHASVYLYYMGTQTSICIRVAHDGTFLFRNIPAGPHTLHTSNTVGFQNVIYNPDDAPGPFPEFNLDEGEQRLDLELKAERAYRISGKIRDMNGEVPADLRDMSVWAVYEEDGRYRTKFGAPNWTDGSYSINGLDDRPVYVMVTNRKAEKEGTHSPPVYYPGTFSRNKATKIVPGENRSIENVDITLRTEGGLTLEGKVADEQGNPIPQALVVAHRSDMSSGGSVTYSDEHGDYSVRGLGDGEFLVHVDAAHRGYVRTRTTVRLGDANKQTIRDFTLTKGVLISGRLVDQDGNAWEIGRSHGNATVGDATVENPAFGFLASNKFGPANVGEIAASQLLDGEGDYATGAMIFPTKSTFAIHGMMAGRTLLQFAPRKEGFEVLEIRYKDSDIRESGIETTPGETIEDVIIVVGNREDKTP